MTSRLFRAGRRPSIRSTQLAIAVVACLAIAGPVALSSAQSRSTTRAARLNNGLIVFQLSVDGVPHVWTARPNERDRQDLGPGAQPVWSPDANAIAFVDPSTGDLATMRPNGRHRRSLEVAGVDPAWSPDGRWLAYAQSGDVLASDGRELWIVRANGADAHAITQDAAAILANGEATSVTGDRDRHPAWSPNGSTIVYGRTSDDDDDTFDGLYTVPAAGATGVAIVSALRRGTVAGGWSRNGRWILYTAESVIHLLAADGSTDVAFAPTHAAGSGYDDVSPTFVAGNSRILYESRGLFPGADNALWGMTIDGDNRVRLFGEVDPSAAPDWTGTR